MSMFPYDWGDFSYRPSRLHDQHFGLGLSHDDFLSPLAARSMSRRPFAYYRPWRASVAEKDAGSTVSVDTDKFQVNLDVQHFTPGEITVKVTGKNTVTIEGKHEEKQDEHGYISRHFMRRYVLPDGLDMDKIASTISSDGVLSISAPKAGNKRLEERSIPVIQTGVPSKSTDTKKE